jgi:hypothetical protein
MTYEHIIDEQGVDHVKIDENQTYKFDFNPNNFKPTALKATLYHALSLLDSVVFIDEIDGPVDIYNIEVDVDEQQIEIRTENHGVYVFSMYENIEIDRASGDTVLKTIDEEQKVKLRFTSELLTMCG